MLFETARREALPVSVWDPLWADPLVAARVGRSRYFALVTGLLELNVALAPPPRFARPIRKTLDLSLDQPLPGSERRVRASSFGILENKKSFGGGRPAVWVRIYGLASGADSSGRFFLSAGIGLEGALSARARLAARFSGGPADRAIVWSGELEGGAIRELLLVGADPALAAEYSAIRAVEISFSSEPVL